MEFLYGYSTVDHLGRLIYRVVIRAVISFRSKGASLLKSRRTLLSVIGLSFLSCIRVHAQSKSKKSKSRKSEKSLPTKRTFNVFGYTLGTKITEWKDIERLTDKKFKDDFVDCYRIQNPSFSSVFKDFDNIVYVSGFVTK